MYYEKCSKLIVSDYSFLFISFFYLFIFFSEIEYSKNFRYFLPLPLNIEIFFDEKGILLFYYFRVSLESFEDFIKNIEF